MFTPSPSNLLPTSENAIDPHARRRDSRCQISKPAAIKSAYLTSSSTRLHSRQRGTGRRQSSDCRHLHPTAKVASGPVRSQLFHTTGKSGQGGGLDNDAPRTVVVHCADPCGRMTPVVGPAFGLHSMRALNGGGASRHDWSSLSLTRKCRGYPVSTTVLPLEMSGRRGTEPNMKMEGVERELFHTWIVSKDWVAAPQH